MPTVRNDFFKLGDNFATIIGDDVKVGDQAPEFTSVLPGWAKVNPLQESKGKVIILSAVPSLDTDVCDRETRRFNEEAAKLGDDIVIYTVSTDFPMAQKRWCGAAGAKRNARETAPVWCVEAGAGRCSAEEGSVDFGLQVNAAAGVDLLHAIAHGATQYLESCLARAVTRIGRFDSQVEDRPANVGDHGFALGHAAERWELREVKATHHGADAKSGELR